MYKRPGRYLQVIITVLFLFTAVFFYCNTPANTPAPDTSDNQTDIPSELGTVGFTVKKISANPVIVDAGEPVTITAELSGEASGTNYLYIKVNGKNIDVIEVILEENAVTSTEVLYTPDSPGLYNIDIRGLTTNIIATEPDGSLLDLIEAEYPELYEELRLLPDLEEIDEKDNAALADIAYLALNPDNKPVFEDMLDEGVREERKYCAPLEALLWIAYEKDFTEYNPFENYTLKRLLNTAWQTTDISFDYDTEKWQDFDTVVDRLSSPPLISLYMRNNFNYDIEEAEEIYLSRSGPAVPAEKTFETKIGTCGDMSRFALHCLINNGYEYASFKTEDNAAAMVGIFLSTGEIGHAICLVKDKGEFYAIDNGLFRGPFPNEETAIHSEAMLTGIENWAQYVYFDNDMAFTGIITADAVKGKGIIMEHVIDPWPETSLMATDNRGDCDEGAENTDGADIQALTAYMDDNYVYIKLQVYGDFQPELGRLYILELDFIDDDYTEYLFGMMPSGFVQYSGNPPYGSRMFTDAWYVQCVCSRDSIELVIPREEYKIPGEILIAYTIVEGDGSKIIDEMDWIPLKAD
jgi:hypothetical protein